MHRGLLAHTRNQADTSPAIPLLSLPSVSVFIFFSSSERGQLENILCSFSAQTRVSQGPLIKDKPSFSLSASFLLSLFLSLCSVTSLHHPYISVSLFSHCPFLFPAAFSHHFSRVCPCHSSLLNQSFLALFAYLSWQRFDIHVGTVFRVNLCKEPDLLFSFASVNYVPCDLSHVDVKRMSRSDSAAPFLKQYSRAAPVAQRPPLSLLTTNSANGPVAVTRCSVFTRSLCFSFNAPSLPVWTVQKKTSLHRSIHLVDLFLSLFLLWFRKEREASAVGVLIQS